MSSVQRRQHETKDWLSETKTEVEHLALQLRVSMGTDGNDWRLHLNEARKLHNELSTSLSTCCPQLEIIEEEIALSLDKAESREKFINKQFEPLLADYNSVRAQLSELEQRRKQSLERINSYNEQLSSITKKLDTVQKTLLEKGNQISDLTPLVGMKNAIHSLSLELQEMEVRLGVFQHGFLQKQVSQSIDIAKLELCEYRMF